jgi:arginyl-tRNA--protein-N-Asp/Glu arginylyltransferase
VPSRSQRRCLKKNQDLTVEIGPPKPSDEKRAIYARYLETRHDGQMDGSVGEFQGFLYTTRVRSAEVVYREAGRIIGVGILDLEPAAMSAVYFYFEPAVSHRALGVFNILWMIDECRRRSLPHLYLGYYVQESPRMRYKAQYRPHEILGSDGTWRRSG